MINPREEDHLVGLELELVELVEQRERALVQRRSADAGRLEREIRKVQEEMAATAEQLVGEQAPRPQFRLPERRSA
ncbi:MAG TPA: hypothetical protein VM264_02895 [Acidimicrobiales bacterium]|nr:hypothetical protein [Acidimicrobiales bacterium]